MRNWRIGIDVLVSLVALSMMVAWKTGSLAWIQWLPAQMPSLFNTSLVIFCASSASISMRLEKNSWAQGFAVFGFMISFMTLMQFFFYTPWEIDQLFHITPESVQPVHPGRMGANTATALLCLCFASLLKSIPSIKKFYVWPMTLVTAISALAIGGYLLNVGTSFGWGPIGGMAPITASCIFVIAITNFKNTLQSLPGQASIGILTLVTLLAFGILNSEERLVKERIHSLIDRDRILFERSMEERESSLKRLANRSALRPRDSELWKADAGKYVSDFSDIWRIYFVSREGNIQLRTSDSKENLPVGIVSDLASSFSSGRAKIYFDPSLDGKLFWFIVPSEDKTGAVISMHETRSFLEAVMGQMWSSHEVYVDKYLAISTLTEAQKVQQRIWGAEFNTKYAGVVWTIKSYPKKNDLTTNVNSMTALLLLSGFLLSIAAYYMLKFYALGRENLEKEQKARLELQTVLDFVPAGIYRTDEHGNCTWVNQRWLMKTGLSEREAMGTGWQSAIHPDDRIKVFHEWESSVKENRPFDLVYRFQGPNKPIIWVHGRSVALKNELGELTGYLGSVVDVTSERLAQERLKQQQLDEIYGDKLKAVGELATGVAYELNNPLAVIQGTIEMLFIQVERNQLSNSALLDGLKKIQSMSERSTKIIKQLREFAHDERHAPMRAYRASALIEDALDLCSTRFKSHGIDIKIRDNDNSDVLCRPEEIEQVLFNLLTNSFEVIKDLENPTIELSASVKGENVQFIVSDSGPGIRSEIVDRIMDPFFTTKDRSEHPGLGLSLARNILLSHDSELVLLANSPHARFSFELKRI